MYCFLVRGVGYTVTLLPKKKSPSSCYRFKRRLHIDNRLRLFYFATCFVNHRGLWHLTGHFLVCTCIQRRSIVTLLCLDGFTHSSRKSLITACCCSLVYRISGITMTIPLVIIDNCMVISRHVRTGKDYNNVSCECSKEISRHVRDDIWLQNLSWNTGTEVTTMEVCA
jgi:hypothetical protein